MRMVAMRSKKVGMARRRISFIPPLLFLGDGVVVAVLSSLSPRWERRGSSTSCCCCCCCFCFLSSKYANGRQRVIPRNIIVVIAHGFSKVLMWPSLPVPSSS